MYMYMYMYRYRYRYMYMYMCTCMYVCMSVCLSVCMYVCVCVSAHAYLYERKCCATKHTSNVAVLAILTSAREELHVGFEQSGCARTAHDHAILVQVVQTCMLGHQMFGSVPPFG